MQTENSMQRLSRLKNEFLARIQSGQIKSYGKNPYGFDIVLKVGTELALKSDPAITAIVVEDFCLTGRIKHTSDWKNRNIKKGYAATMYSFTMFDNFNIV